MIRACCTPEAAPAAATKYKSVTTVGSRQATTSTNEYYALGHVIEDNSLNQGALYGPFYLESLEGGNFALRARDWKYIVGYGGDEELFDVTVLKVRTMVRRGKVKGRGPRASRKPDWKRAVVTLAEGDSVEFL